MRRIICATTMTLIVLATLPTASAEEITVKVDCDRGQTISKALAVGDTHKLLVIEVRGTCRESVSIVRDNVTLRGDGSRGAIVSGPSPTEDTIVIMADRVNIEGLTVTGSMNGIRLQGPYYAVLRGLRIEYTGAQGIAVRSGDAAIQDCTVQYAGGHGLALHRGGSARVLNSAFLDSAGAGIFLQTNSTVDVSGSTVTRSGGPGIQLERASQATIRDSAVAENGGPGIGVGSSQADVVGSSIQDNGGSGIVGTLAKISATDNTITGNGVHGMDGYLASVLVLDGNRIENNRNSGVVGYAHSTVQIAGATILNNRGGAGISMMLGSKLLLIDRTTVSQGNVGALWCGDQESSFIGEGLLDSGGDTVWCSGY